MEGKALTVDEKIEHLMKLGITGEMTEVRKMYSGEKFNKEDETYKTLLEKSKELCIRFTKLSQLISRAKGKNRIAAYKKEKEEILDKLFPGHGIIYGGQDGLFAVIGMVQLDGKNYINTRVHFNKSVLVHLGISALAASNVEFGKQEDVDKIEKIDIEDDTWIGANNTIEGNVTVGPGSIIGMGSKVTSGSNLPGYSICVGNPCAQLKTIPEEFETKVKIPPQEGYRTREEIKKIINKLKQNGINGNFSEYIKAINYGKYNSLEPTTSKIYELSHKLCSEYNSKDTSKRRKREIIDILFPLHGDNLEVGDDIFVDCMGTVKIGNNVKIGNGATLAGNITIGDNVKIGNNVALQTTGHEIYYKGRKVTDPDENGVCIVLSTPGYIIIDSEIVLADGTKVIPDKRVTKNTEENELVTK